MPNPVPDLSADVHGVSWGHYRHWQIEPSGQVVADAARAEAMTGLGYRFVGNLTNGKTVLEKNAY